MMTSILRLKCAKNVGWWISPEDFGVCVCLELIGRQENIDADGVVIQFK